MTLFRFSCGKHAGEPLYDVPLSYLKWAVKTMDSLSASEKAALHAEIYRQEERRSDQGYGGQGGGWRRPPLPPSGGLRLPAGSDPETAVEVIRAGRRALALKHHPDHGGDPSRMLAVNVVADYLESTLKQLTGGRR